MATELQKNLAQEIIKNTKRKKPLNKKELLVSSGYSELSAEQSAKFIIEQKGVQEALEDYGFTEDNAKKVVAQILLNEKTEPNARIRAAQEVFKVRGSYAPEKSVNLNLNASTEIEQQANDAISKFLNGNTTNPTK